MDSIAHEADKQYHKVTKNYRKYQQARQEHPSLSAKYAWRTATQKRKSVPSFAWQELHYGKGAPVKYAVLERDGFECVISVYYDYDHDWCSGRGQFTDTWEEGVILNPGFRGDYRTFRYFIPEVSIAEHRAELQKKGYARAAAEEMARKYVYEDAKIAADPTQAGYGAYGVVVVAKFQDVELGTDSLWGIELDDEDSYLDEVAQECLCETIAEAKKKLQELREKR